MMGELKLKLIADKEALISSIKDVVSKSNSIKLKAEGGGSAGGGGLGNIAAEFKKFALPIAGIALLVKSSQVLQGVLGGIFKAIQLIVRPIGDIIGIGLRPIIEILRPIGLFFRILMAPYIKKATEAMNLGRQLSAKGDVGGAAEAYGLGAMYVLKPVFDLMVTTSTIALEGIVAVLKLGFGSILGVFDNVFGTQAKESFDGIMNSLIEKISNGGIGIINSTNDWMAEQLSVINQKWEEVKNQADVKMSDFNGVVGGGFIAIINAVTGFMTGEKQSVKAEVVSGGQQIADAAKTSMTNMKDAVQGTTDDSGFKGVIKKTSEGMKGVNDAVNIAWSEVRGKVGSLLSEASSALQDIKNKQAEANQPKEYSWYDPRGWFDDFIARPGSPPAKFSPDDTIIGVKDPSKLMGGGGDGITIQVNVTGNYIRDTVDVDSIARKITNDLRNEMRAAGR